MTGHARVHHVGWCVRRESLPKLEDYWSSAHLQAFDTHTMAMLSNGVVEADHVKTERGWRIQRYTIVESITDADMDAFEQAVPR